MESFKWSFASQSHGAAEPYVVCTSLLLDHDFFCLVPFHFGPCRSRSSSPIRLPVNRYRLSFCTVPFVRPRSRISDSPSLRHDNNILSTDNAIFPDKGERMTEGGGAATSSRLFSLSSSQGCSVFLRRIVEFKGIKYRLAPTFFSPGYQIILSIPLSLRTRLNTLEIARMRIAR